MSLSAVITSFWGVMALDGGSRIIAQLALIGAARLLGAEEFGALIVAMTIFGICTVLADGGLGESALQRLTTRPGASEAFRAEQGRDRWHFGLAVTALSAGLASLAAQMDLVGWGAVIFSLAIPPWALITNRALELRILERLRSAALVTAAMNIALAGSPLIAAIWLPDALWAVTASAAVLWLLSAPQCRDIPTMSLPRKALARDLSRALPFLVTALAVALYSRGDRLVLASLADERSVGLYSAAYTIVLGASLVGSAIQLVVLPRAIRMRANSTSSFQHGLRRSLQIWLMAIPPVALVALSADSLMNTIFGGEFAAGATVLAVLAFAIPFYMVNPYLATLLVAAGQERRVTRVAVANLMAAAVLFPIATASGGASHLAVASVAVELLGHMLLLIALRRTYQGSSYVVS